MYGGEDPSVESDRHKSITVWSWVNWLHWEPTGSIRSLGTYPLWCMKYTHNQPTWCAPLTAKSAKAGDGVRTVKVMYSCFLAAVLAVVIAALNSLRNETRLSTLAGLPTYRE
jgi:hypothetical protein